MSTVTPDTQFGITMTHTFPILALSGFVDTLRHSADDDNRNRQIYCGWSLAGPSLDPVISSAGISVQPDTTFDDLPDPDYLVIIGGLMPFIDQAPPETLAYIQAYYQRGGTVVGLCTGSFVVAQAGLLNGKKAVVHHRHRRDFKQRYPGVTVSSRDLFIEDGRVITSPGGTASIDLAINLLARKLGRQRALKGLVEMSIDRHRGSFDMARTPLESADQCEDVRIKMAVELMRENLANPTPIHDIAEAIGISASQLNRLFHQHTQHSPRQYLLRMRLEQARWRLLNTSRSITQIAYECGFSDAPHFSRQFSQHYKDAPGRFRRNRLA